MGYRRMLFVGLGGSGGKALRFLKRDFTEWCTQNGWFDTETMEEQKTALPYGVQFLNIDTPMIQDGLSQSGPLLSDDEYRGLVGSGMTMPGLMAQVDAGDVRGESLVGWRVSPNTRVRVSDAGGQMRAIGRSISRAYAASVQTSLVGVLNAVQSDRATTEMQELFAAVHGAAPKGVADDPSTQPPVTVFISSLAGGTGAGLLFDVVDIYRSLEPDLMDLTVGIWFTPDAFPEAFGQGLRPNALAAISEMLNGSWWLPKESTSARGVSVPVRDTRALEAVASLPNTINRSGVWVNYLVGQTNIEGHRMDSDGRLFEKVGGALLSWIVDPVLQDTLVSKVWGNYENNRESEKVESPWNYGSITNTDENSGFPIFDSLGFSRVSLGTRYFTQYSVERLARRVVNHLTRAHVDSEWAQSEKRASGFSNPAQIVDYIAKRRFSAYRDVLDVRDELDESALRELFANDRSDSDKEKRIGAVYGDLLEKALEPEALQVVKRERIDGLLQYAEQLDALPIDQWAEQFVPVINEDVRDALHRAVVDALPERIAEWVALVSEKTVLRAEEAIGTYGLEIAADILDKLSLEIRDVVIPAVKLLEDESAYTGGRKSVHDEFIERIGGEFDDKRKVGADEAATAIRGAVNAVAFSASAEVLRQAGVMLERYRDGLLRPLVTQIGLAASRLDASRDETQNFPVDEDQAAPPKHLLPPQSESTVIDNEEFGSIFTKCIQETYRDKPPAKAKDAAVEELASGSFAREKLGTMSPDDPFRGVYERAQVVDVQRDWVVGYDLVGGREAEAPATISIRVGLKEIMERSELWLKRPRFPFGEFIAMDLRSYADGDKSRQQRVLSRLREAIDTAQPLVQLYDDTSGTMHPKNMLNQSSRVRFSITKVPFNNSSIEKEVRDLLTSRIFANEGSKEDKKDAVEAVMSNVSELPYIDIVSWLSTPVSPVVVKTLMEPLVESWTGVKDDPFARREYWRNRRARPLGEFIPLPQAQLIAALRGWFTGRALGLIDVGDPVQSPFRILGGSQTEDPRWYEFPSNLLSEVVDPADVGAVVLESLSLAIAFSYRTRGASLQPYAELVKLGMSEPKDRVSEVFEYSQPHPIIRQWITDGRVALRVPVEQPLPARIEAAPDPTGRQKQLSAFFSANRKAFKESFDNYFTRDVVRSREVLNGAPLWPGLHQQIDAAHAMLVAGIDAYRFDRGTGEESVGTTPIG